MSEIHSTNSDLEALMVKINAMSVDELRVEIFKLGRQFVDFKKSFQSPREPLQGEVDRIVDAAQKLMDDWLIKALLTFERGLYPTSTVDKLWRLKDALESTPRPTAKESGTSQI